MRASFSRYAGQLATGTIGYANPAAAAGVAVYGWNDLNGDHLASPNEVNLNQFVAAANGFNRANPTAVTSANVIDPNLKAPVTSSFVAGVDRELRPNLAVQANYTYTRVSNLFGNLFANITPRVGVPASTATTRAAPASPARCRTARRTTSRRTFRFRRSSRRAAAASWRRTRPATTPTTTASRSPSARMTGKWMGRARAGVQQRARALRRSERHLRHQRQPDADDHRAARRWRRLRAAEHGQRPGRDLHERAVAVQRERRVRRAVRHRARGERLRPAGLSDAAVPSGLDGRARLRLVAEHPRVADDRLRAVCERVGHGHPRRARFQSSAR